MRIYIAGTSRSVGVDWLIGCHSRRLKLDNLTLERTCESPNKTQVHLHADARARVRPASEETLMPDAPSRGSH